MTKIYLVHGWGGNPTSEGWFGWLIYECRERNIELTIPEMPNTDYPRIEEWIGKLKKVVDIETNNDIYLIGHSIGCQAIMRYLEKLPRDKKIKGLIFIAGWFNLIDSCLINEKEREIAKPWLEIPIDTKKVKKHAEKIIAIFSADDHCVPVSDAELFKKRLMARIIIKEDEGHFNESQQIKEIIDFIENVN